MKTFWYGLVIGALFALFTFQLISANTYRAELEECSSDKTLQGLRKTAHIHDLRLNLTQQFLDTLLESEDPKAYLSHISQCRSQNNTDQCLLEFARNADQGACLLLPDQKLASCLE
ncbi:MAG: hypothetical protein ACQESG_07745 [Nanobdellota archaeon]